jgi:hypothetical protein
MPHSRSGDVWKPIARTLIDVCDVDIQKFMAGALLKLRSTTTGSELADWARANPLAFEAFLRLVSGLCHKIPRNDSLLLDKLVDQLARLPLETRRVVLQDRATGATTTLGTEDHMVFEDNFHQKYEAAVQGLSDDALRSVADLSPARLKEWVLSPPAIRPFLLEKWQKDDAKAQAPSYALEGVKKIAKKLAAERDRIDADIAASPVSRWARDLRERMEAKAKASRPRR